MIDRNRRIKNCPEKFQLCKEMFDILITCEERVYDQVNTTRRFFDVVIALNYPLTGLRISRVKGDVGKSASSCN